MRKFSVILLFLTLFPLSSLAQPDTLWTRTYGGINDDDGEGVQQTTDGGYIVVGWTESGGGACQVYLLKTDANGDTIWTRTYGGENGSAGYSVQLTADGGYIVTGSTHYYSADSIDVYLVKTNAVGDTIWTRAFGGISDDKGWSVRQTFDGGYIIAGYTYSFGAGLGDVYLIKTFASGDTMWTKTYGGTDEEWGWCVQQTSDSGYVIVGQTYSFGSGDGDVYLIKTDAGGDSMWTRTYGGVGDDWGVGVQQTVDGGYIIVGQTLSFGLNNGDVWLIKTDDIGDTLWTRVFGGDDDDWGKCVQQTNDGGYIVVGSTAPHSSSTANVYLIRTDSNGDSLWTCTYGGSDWDAGFSVEQTPDEGYIIAATTASYGAGGLDVYLIRLAGDSTFLYGNQSGTIYTGEYRVVGDITVAVGDSLVIEPGVSLLFTGDYDLSVYGYLSAVGTETDSIHFTADSTTDYWGSVIFRIGSSDDSELSYCYITGCSLGGINCYYVDISISHCTIVDNIANWGGGIYLSSAGPVISDCFISGNYSGNNGGGIYCTHSNPEIIDCIISENRCEGYGSGKGGGGVCFNHFSNGSISGCAIFDNSSGFYGGGISCNDESNPAIGNCTISGNSSDLSGAGILICWASPSIVNTIVEGNTGSTGVYLYASPEASISYGDFYNNEYGDFRADSLPLPEGLGEIVTINANGDSCDIYFNIFENPLYYSITGDSAFHLTEDSPCIDAGDPESPLDPDGTCADIGAFYFHHTTGVKAAPKEKIPASYSLSSPFPNPFNPETNLIFDLPQAGYVTLVIYDIQGRGVARLIDGYYPPGSHKQKFNSVGLSSGIYFARLTAGNFRQTRKLLLIK